MTSHLGLLHDVNLLGFLARLQQTKLGFSELIFPSLSFSVYFDLNAKSQG